MNTITELIENIENADTKLEELTKNEYTETTFYKKLLIYKTRKKASYDRMMKRKNSWDLFGIAKQGENDAYTICGDDIFMEMVNGNKIIENKPNYFKFYEHLNITDEMKEDNYKRFKKIQGAYKTTKESYINPNGTTSNIYVTRPIEVEKYKNRFEVSRGKTQITNKKRTLEDICNEVEENGTETISKTSSKYVPPSIKYACKTNGEFIEPNRKLIIRNIARDIMEDDIANIIMTCGKLYDVRIHRDKYTGESKGFAFVKCETHIIAKKIIETYDRKPLGHMIMRIDFAEDKNRNKR
jgi:hypothetical protein